MTMTAAACSRKLAKFSAVRNVSELRPKMATSTTIARIAGSEPRSPLRSRLFMSLIAVPKVRLALSSAKSLSASLGPGVGEAGVGTEDMFRPPRC